MPVIFDVLFSAGAAAQLILHVGLTARKPYFAHGNIIEHNAVLTVGYIHLRAVDLRHWRQHCQPLSVPDCAYRTLSADRNRDPRSVFTRSENVYIFANTISLLNTLATLKFGISFPFINVV